MEFLSKINALSDRIAETQKHIQTEEATKQALVIPLISALGYDVHDPRELIPEYTADVGTKKGEKVDYAIMKGGQPIMLIECKMPGIPLDDKANLDQLIRYFGVTKARIAVLTNGILYRFFTDLDAPNLMDQKPFLAFSLLDIEDDVVAELQRFCKDWFDINQIVSAATELKYIKAISAFLTEQSRSPTDKFVQFLASHVCNEKPTTRVMHQIRGATKRAMGQMTTGQIAEKPKPLIMVKNDQHEPPQTGQTVSAKTDQEKSTSVIRRWDEPSFLEKLTEGKNRECATTAKRIIDWMRNNMDGLEWGNGKNSTAMGVIKQGGKAVKPFQISSRGSVWVAFETLTRWSPFPDPGKRLELLEKLNAIDGINISREMIKKWPWFPLEAIQDEESLTMFLSAMKWTADEIRKG